MEGELFLAGEDEGVFGVEPPPAIGCGEEVGEFVEAAGHLDVVGFGGSLAVGGDGGFEGALEGEGAEGVGGGEGEDDGMVLEGEATEVEVVFGIGRDGAEVGEDDLVVAAEEDFVTFEAEAGVLGGHVSELEVAGVGVEGADVERFAVGGSPDAVEGEVGGGDGGCAERLG